MSPLPTLAFVLGSISLLLHLFGLRLHVELMLGITTGVAVMAVAKAKPEIAERLSAAFTGLMAVLAAATPLLVPVVLQLRLARLEAIRARETASMYKALDALREPFRKAVLNYHTAHGVFPDLDAEGKPLPAADATGRINPMPPVEGFALRDDPFRPDSKLRWAAIPGLGVMLVSVGQDGLREMPLPGASLEYGNADPLAGVLSLGVDVRLVTYDPTNGALGNGDIVVWAGREEYSTALSPAFAALDRAEKRSPMNWKPTAEQARAREQARRDATGAAALSGEGDDRAALALASRAILQRGPVASWSPEERRASFLRGHALYQLQAYRSAADALVDHLVAAPNDGEAHGLLGCAYYLGGDAENARIHWGVASQTGAGGPVAEEAAEHLKALAANRLAGCPPGRSGVKPAAPAPASAAASGS